MRSRSMKHVTKKDLHVLVLACTISMGACANSCGPCHVSPYISIRSASENAARELAGWTQQVNLADKDEHYGSFSLTPEYTRSFRAQNIAKQLFGCDLQRCCSINITGSAVPNRNNTTDWLADYFFLPKSYTGSFRIEPIIQNFLVDFNFYWGMAKYEPGLFFRIHAPLTWTQWDLHVCMGNETLGTALTGLVPPFSSSLTDTHRTVHNFIDFSCGHVVPLDIARTIPTTPDSPVGPAQFINYRFVPLNYSRICPCKRSLTRLSNIQADFGWNFLLDEDYHLGLFVRGAAPTGNRPHGILLFEPIVGNGKSWELGGGLTSHITLWRSPDNEDHHIGFYLDANITHLFGKQHCRFFDLCGKPWSRYQLAFRTVSQTVTTENPVITNSLTELEFSPVANLTAHAVKVSVGIQADIAALFNYTYGNFGFDFGYNFWGKSCEKFRCHTSCNSSNKLSYALNAGCPSDCSASSLCVCTCPTFYGELDGKTWSLAGPESYIQEDHPIIKSYSNATIHGTDAPDNERQYLKQSDLDIDGARAGGMSHKIFTHFSYTWDPIENWIPYVGFGGEVEFAGNKKCCTANTPSHTQKYSCCTNTAISQWGIWTKGGISF